MELPRPTWLLAALVCLPLCQMAAFLETGRFKPGHEDECYLTNEGIYMKIGTERPLLGCRKAICSADDRDPEMFVYEEYSCGVYNPGPGFIQVPGERFAVYDECCDKWVRE